ncbi:hypothetical protein HY389_01970 [Candidatus Daviesbacteria bacterium]|nr:hypothetical protein [Candidatus Daviesbacteria bacterium]
MSQDTEPKNEGEGILNRPVSRRGFIRGLIGTSAAGLLAACAPGANPEIKKVAAQTPIPTITPTPEPTSTPTPEPTSTPEPTPTPTASEVDKFDEGVSAEDKEYILRGLEIGRKFYTEDLGIQFTKALTVDVRSTDPGKNRAAYNEPGRKPNEQIIIIHTNHPAWIRSLPKERSRIAAHELFHTAQSSLMRPMTVATYTNFPAWIGEGSAECMSAKAFASAGLINYDEFRDNYLKVVRQANSLPTLPKLDPRDQGPNYALATIATDYLISKTSINATIDFFRKSKLSDWETPFMEAFGIDPESFYQEFDGVLKNLRGK